MKRIIALAMAALLVSAASITAFAQQPSGGKITGMTQGLSMGYSSAQTQDVYLGEIFPQDKRWEYIYLYDYMFTWDTELTGEEPSLLTPSQIRAANLTARSTNNKVIKEIGGNASKSRIEMEFLDELVSVKDLEFDLDVTLSLDGRRQNDYSIRFTGTLANPVVEMDKDESSADISDGAIVLARENIPTAELELGCGVTAKARLIQDKKYYGIADNTPLPLDQDIVAKHKSIEEVVHLKTVNLQNAKASVHFDSVLGEYHVYDDQLKYLGKAKEALPYSDTYYLTSLKLAVTETEEEVTKTQEILPPTGQVQHPEIELENVNHNPQTGK